MVSVLGAAASGLRDAATRLNVAAHNIANVNTPGFQPHQVDSVEVTGGGVAPVVSEPPAASEPSAPLMPASGTDLAQESIRLVIALIMVTANTRMLKAAAEADRGVLDTLA